MLQLNLSKGSWVVYLMGSWQEADSFQALKPSGGLAYYMSPPMSFLDILYKPD